MKVFVTGGNGFVGSHLVAALVERGATVTCVVRRTSNLQWIQNLSLRLITGTFLDPEPLLPHLEGQDVVFHLAGKLRGKDYPEYYRVNAEGTDRLAEAALRAGVGRFVFCSSLAAAGPSSRGRPRTEEDPPAPITDYGKSKLEGERRLAERMEGRGEFVILRPPAVYGPRDRDIWTYFRWVSRGVVPVPGEGNQEIDLIYVSDLVRALLLAAEAPQTVGRTYFLNDGKHHRWRALLRHIAEAVGTRPVPVSVPLWTLGPIAWVAERWAARSGREPLLHRQKLLEIRQPAWTCNAGRIAKELGFRPEVPLPVGLERTVRWYREMGWLKEIA